MKKVLFLVFIFLVFASSPCLAKFVSVITTEAFLYEEPDYFSEIAAGIPKDYPLYVLKKSGDWYKVRDWLWTVGWIPTSEVCSDRTLIVRRIKVNFRSGPGPKYKKIATLYKGYILKVLGRKYKWYKVKLIDPPNGTVGWIYRTLVWGY